ncbi:MAG: SURF1-like protein [marine bacterium B5-7]|nr:MAG: SURF1-like protein [marine bacterium B5-7]
MVLFGLFIFLGCWQLDRAEEKRTLYAEFENRQLDVAIDLNQVDSTSLGSNNFLWRSVTAKGAFVENFQVLLDNQIQNTKAGYYVYTPFHLADGENTVLVNRGWLVADPDRKIIPKLTTSKGMVEIQAVVKEIPKTGLLLKEFPPEEMSKGIYRVQRIDLGELAGLTNTKLLPYVIRLSPESEHGYHRQWRLPGSGENVHNGYAFQWFIFATALFIIYLLLNIKRRDASGKTYE